MKSMSWKIKAFEVNFFYFFFVYGKIRTKDSYSFLCEIFAWPKFGVFVPLHEQPYDKFLHLILNILEKCSFSKNFCNRRWLFKTNLYIILYKSTFKKSKQRLMFHV